MRHLGSLVLTAIFAPSALILVGRGYGWFTEATGQPPDQIAMLFALAALVLGGVLYALLTLPRFSPLGPVIAGGAYLGFGLWALADLEHLLATVPGEVLGLDDAMVSTTAALSPLLAVPLLATGYSARRWRGKAAGADPRTSLPAYPPPAYQAAPLPPGYRAAPLPYPAPTLPPAHTVPAGGGPVGHRPNPTAVLPAVSLADQPTEPIPVTVAPDQDTGNGAPPTRSSAERASGSTKPSGSTEPSGSAAPSGGMEPTDAAGPDGAVPAGATATSARADAPTDPPGPAAAGSADRAGQPGS